MRRLLLVLVALLARGESLDDAARSLAKNVAEKLAPGEVARVSERSLTPAFAVETARARTLLERALRRPQARGATSVEVVVTATENSHGPLLVAEIRRDQETFVETAAYDSPPAAPRPKLVSRLLWEQETPILDVAQTADGGLLVLSPSGVSLCHREPAGCEIKQTRPVFPAVRDPRGRLTVSGDAFTAYFPNEGSGDFQIDGETVHFTPGQNTLENANGEKFFSIARAGSFRIVAGLDGRTRISQGAQSFVFDDWGSDFAGIAASCEPGPMIVAASPSESNASDSAAAYEITGQNPRAASDPLQFSGPVTALWPSAGGALAVVHQLGSGRYAAYNLTLDCGR